MVGQNREQVTLQSSRRASMRRPLGIIRLLTWLDEQSAQREARPDRRARRPVKERCEERIAPGGLIAAGPWEGSRAMPDVIPSKSYAGLF